MVPHENPQGLMAGAGDLSCDTSHETYSVVHVPRYVARDQDRGLLRVFVRGLLVRGLVSDLARHLSCAPSCLGRLELT